MKVNNEKGATMVEFTIAMIIFLMFLGAITDLGLSLHRKSMLTYVAKEVSRLVSIRLVTSGNCVDIANTITGRGSEIAKDEIGVPVDSWRVLWHTSLNGQTYPSFNMTLSSQAPCFFLCNLFPNGLVARVSVESTVSRLLDSNNNQFVCPDLDL